MNRSEPILKEHPTNVEKSKKSKTAKTPKEKISKFAVQAAKPPNEKAAKVQKENSNTAAAKPPKEKGAKKLSSALTWELHFDSVNLPEIDFNFVKDFCG